MLSAAALPDGSNVADAPLPRPHLQPAVFTGYRFPSRPSLSHCYLLRHTCCSAAYCLHTRSGVQKCHFGYPKPLKPEAVLVLGENENDKHNKEPELITARNDGLLNYFNLVQLSAWHANVDMQYCVSWRKVIEYVTKYAATKSEPHSLPLKEVYAIIVRSLKDDSRSLRGYKSFSLTVWGRETIQLRRHATCYFNYL